MDFKRTGIYCANCGKGGHLYRNCRLPILSYGIILYNITNDNNIKYLHIRRKDTIGYVEFLRGNYSLENHNYICEIISFMTDNERNKLLFTEFDVLWFNLWNNYESNKKFKNEYSDSKNKFNKLKETDLLKNMISGCTIHWDETEWGFPKGRRNGCEDDLNCARREFEEETNIPIELYSINTQIYPLIEEYIGSNNVRYRHTYYTAEYLGNNINNICIDPHSPFQINEISAIDWFSKNVSLMKIRHYHKEKKNLIEKLDRILKKKIFYNYNR